MEYNLHNTKETIPKNSLMQPKDGKAQYKLINVVDFSIKRLLRVHLAILRKGQLGK